MSFDPSAIAAVFGRAAPTYDSVIPFFAEFGTRLVDCAELRPGESVLDVGCGRGATLLPAAERVGPAGHVLGVDLSEEMVALLEADIGARGVANASVRRADATHLPVQDGSVDVVLSGFVLHLLADPSAAAAEQARVVRPGGRVVASAPAITGPEWQFLWDLFERYSPRAVRPLALPFRPDFDLPATLRDGGLDTVSVTRVDMDFTFADERAWWAWGWSQGYRALYEALDPSDLDALRQDALAGVRARLTPTGIPMRQTATFVVASP